MSIEDDKFRRPKEVEPSITEIIKNSEYWNKRRLIYCGDNIYFDQEIRTGVCYFCKRNGRAQKSKKTVLHHVKYDHSNKLDWTIEVCYSCHWQIDSKNRKAIAKSTGREIPVRYGEYYLNKQQRKEKEEQDKKDWFKEYCYNFSSGWVPIKEIIPNQEFYDKVVEAIKKDNAEYRKEKTTFKKEPMSNVSRRYY